MAHIDSQTLNPIDSPAKIMLPVTLLLTDGDYGAHNESIGSRGLHKEVAFARPNRP